MLHSKKLHRLPCGHTAVINYTEHTKEMSCAECGAVVASPLHLREWPICRKSGKAFPKKGE